MIIEVMSLVPPPGKQYELGKALASLVGPTQAQPGCLSCCLLQTFPAKDLMQLETRWDSKECLTQHLRSDVYKHLLLLMEQSATPPVLEFLGVLELRGLDLVETARTSLD